MWISATHKARIIVTEASNPRPAIEVFRWSDEASGWVHVADVDNEVELAKLVDLSQVEETTELS